MQECLRPQVRANILKGMRIIMWWTFSGGSVGGAIGLEVVGVNPELQVWFFEFYEIRQWIANMLLKVWSPPSQLVPPPRSHLVPSQSTRPHFFPKFPPPPHFCTKKKTDMQPITTAILTPCYKNGDQKSSDEKTTTSRVGGGGDQETHRRDANKQAWSYYLWRN